MQVISIKDAFNRARFYLSSALLSEIPYTENPQKSSSILPIPTQNFVQSRCSEGYFWHPASRTFSQSLISARFCFKIPKLELRIREVPDPEKHIGNTLYRRGSPSGNNRAQENNVQV